MTDTLEKIERALKQIPTRPHRVDIYHAEGTSTHPSSSSSCESKEGNGRIEHTNTIEEGNKNNNVILIKTTEERLLEAERILSTEIFQRNEVPDHFLTWSAAVSFFHILQCLIQFLIAMDNTNDKWYWFVSYPDATSDDTRKPELKEIASFSILWLVPLIPLLSGIQHLSNLVFRENFTYFVERHQNPYRWTEYTLSASLMKVLIAQLVGVTDIHLLVCIFMLMAVSIQSAATHECVNAKARSENRSQYWRPFWTSWISHITNWVIIFDYHSVYSRNGGPDAGFIWLVLLSQFMLDNSFAILFTFQWKKVWFGENYMAAENGFLFLSLLAKTCLTWLTIIHVNR